MSWEVSISRSLNIYHWAEQPLLTFSFLIETPLALLVVGLGGGSLPLFVHDHFPKSRVDAVEIDPSMLEVATRWFGFSQSDRMKVHIADGLAYITSLAGGEGTAGRVFRGVLVMER